MHRAWDVYRTALNEHTGRLYRKHLDTVFYNDGCDEQYVHSSLINHDGFPSDIEIEGDGLAICSACEETIPVSAVNCPHCKAYLEDEYKYPHVFPISREVLEYAGELDEDS